MTATGQTRLVCAQKANARHPIELLLKVAIRLFARAGCRVFARIFTIGERGDSVAQLMWESERNFSNVNLRRSRVERFE